MQNFLQLYQWANRGDTIAVCWWHYHSLCIWKLLAENDCVPIFSSSFLCAIKFVSTSSIQAFGSFHNGKTQNGKSCRFEMATFKNKKPKIIQRTFLIETMVTNVGYTNNYILSLLMCALLSRSFAGCGYIDAFILFHFGIIFIVSVYSRILITRIGRVFQDYSVSWFMLSILCGFLFTCKNSIASIELQ